MIWGKYDLSFDSSEPEAYRRDVPNAEVRVLDAGHFALRVGRQRRRDRNISPRFHTVAPMRDADGL